MKGFTKEELLGIKSASTQADQQAYLMEQIARADELFTEWERLAKEFLENGEESFRLRVSPPEGGLWDDTVKKLLFDKVQKEYGNQGWHLHVTYSEGTGWASTSVMTYLDSDATSNTFSDDKDITWVDAAIWLAILTAVGFAIRWLILR
jgi:hypothetical protein